MKEIFEQYGGILITVTAILTVIIVIVAVIGTNDQSVVAKAFSGIVTNFFNLAQDTLEGI